jgi:hypothetical protein
VLPLEQIIQCDFSPDTTLVLPTSVTTWREAAARRIGEIKPANELNTSLQRLISNVTPSAKFGTNETVLDYNFTDPQLIIVKASDLTACAQKFTTFLRVRGLASNTKQQLNGKA